MTIVLVYMLGVGERRVTFTSAEALERRMHWLRDRETPAVAYEGEREVGRVGPVDGGAWDWWFQPDLFTRDEP